MTYPIINGTSMGTDLTQIIVYSNTITGGWFVRCVLFSFFMIVLIAGAMMSQRFKGEIKPEQHFAAACFATFGLASFFMIRPGMLGIWDYVFIIGLNIIAAIWLFQFSD